MTTPTLSQLQTAFAANKYTWHPQLNLIGVRSFPGKTDAFDDTFVCAFMQPKFLLGDGSVLEAQRFLNQWFFLGLNGKPLVEDGIVGKNYNFAEDQYQRTVGKWRIRQWPVTTDPGLYYLQNPLNPDGCAVVKPGQYGGVWTLGFHQGKANHPALVQHGSTITVYLDNDRDKTIEGGGKTKSGYFGINCHHASMDAVSVLVGKWSAGCQVFPSRTQHEQLLSICRHFEASVGKRFTYTLLGEKQIL